MPRPDGHGAPPEGAAPGATSAHAGIGGRAPAERAPAPAGHRSYDVDARASGRTSWAPASLSRRAATAKVQPVSV